MTNYNPTGIQRSRRVTVQLPQTKAHSAKKRSMHHPLSCNKTINSLCSFFVVKSKREV